MVEKQTRILLTIWTIISCLLGLIAPLVYVYLWNNVLCYKIIMAAGLLMVSLRVILAGGLFAATINQERTSFVKFNTRQAKISVLALFVTMALNMMYIHI